MRVIAMVLGHSSVGSHMKQINTAQQLYRLEQSWVWTLAARLPPRRALTFA